MSSYYRCDACGHVWTYPKGEELTAEPRAVTRWPGDGPKGR